jgi:hypothetical protein
LKLKLSPFISLSLHAQQVGLVVVVDDVEKDLPFVHGFNALWLAVMSGDLTLVQALIDAKADTNFQNKVLVFVLLKCCAPIYIYLHTEI